MSADLTHEHPSAVFVRFLIDADCSPGLLSRLLQPYARRDLVPDRMWSHRAGDTMHVEIAMEAMPAEAVTWSRAIFRKLSGCAASRGWCVPACARWPDGPVALAFAPSRPAALAVRPA